ncbi:RNA polymerase sigma factor [Sedimentibacter hydroxybenzoicus DSM 7310]|uniref:RNA polymerase sigma factor n=1 Tax=Sedimentibacter hydroxybenzoicus DSM 7310 TaxID=1123245 RepID=A0A974BHW2_SEDHY|nr:RNA polymerase sigma factor [Sedimentibacter hydroxybenzoicus]NYB73216.1 RNA polymerase sigma factor [Sedimentibacter hydroxybenzoicus DSM 7310]
MIFYLSLIDNQEDKDKFEYIYTNFRHTMLYEAKYILRDEDMAEDAVHEAFIKIIKNISKISTENRNRLRSLLVLIVKQKSIDMIRKNEKEETDYVENIEKIQDENEEIHDEVLDKVLSIHGVRHMMGIIAELEDAYKIPLELKLFHEYSNKEIAEILDLSEGHVRIRIFRARQQIIKKYEQENE